jgi:hypothetical protein
MLTDFWAFLGDQTDAFQALGAVATILGLGFVLLQLRAQSAQRDVAESIQICVDLDDVLGDWSKDKSSENLGRLLVRYEIIAAALNAGRFSTVARKLLRHCVKDGLAVVCADQSTIAHIDEMSHEPEVFKELRVFLLNSYRLLKKMPGKDGVCSTFFGRDAAMFVLDDCFGGFLARRVYVLRASL